MAQELPATTAHRLALALDGWSRWEAGLRESPRLVRVLPGKTNDNFLLASEDRRLTLRLNNPVPDPGIDRRIEKQVLADIAARPFAPRVIHLTDDLLVTEYIAGDHPSVTAGPDLPEKIGALYRDIHSTPTRIVERLDPWDHAEAYLTLLDGEGRAPDTRLARAIDTVMAARFASPTGVCLCHHDLLAENILLAPAGTRVIDWEYARLGDPAFDVAVFVETYDLDQAALTALLSGYGNHDLRPAIETYRVLYALIETLWCLYRQVDSRRVAERFITRCQQNSSQLQ